MQPGSSRRLPAAITSSTWCSCRTESPGTSTGSNTRCYHDHSGCNYAWGDHDGIPYTFGYVVASSKATTYFSRETANALTSFGGVRVQGCSYVNGGGIADQVADLCQCQTERWQSGITSQAYWSVADNACVIPETWGPLSYDTLGKSGDWNDTTYRPRQAYGGGGGVVFTDASDNAWFFDEDTGVATQFGGPGAEFAAGYASDGSGRTVIAGLTTDTKYGVNYYDIGTKKWYATGAPNGPLTSVTVTGQGIIVATDTYAQPWYYVPADRPNAKWVRFGGPGDEFVAVGKDIYALNPARDAVFVWPWQNFGSSGFWTQVRWNARYMNLVGTSEATNWAASVPGERAFWPGGDELGQFVDTSDFAVTDLVQATFVAGGETVLAQSTFSATWSEIGQYPVGRLISGSHVFATSCPDKYPCVVLSGE